MPLYMYVNISKVQISDRPGVGSNIPIVRLEGQFYRIVCIVHVIEEQSLVSNNDAYLGGRDGEEEGRDGM